VPFEPVEPDDPLVAGLLTIMSFSLSVGGHSISDVFPYGFLLPTRNLNMFQLHFRHFC